jgi:hypothetical protein
MKEGRPRTDLVDEEGVRELVHDDVVVGELDALGAPELVRRGIDLQTQHEALGRSALVLYNAARS